MNRLVVTIPGVPAACLSPNARPKRRERLKAVAQAKRDAFYATKQALGELNHPDLGAMFPDGPIWVRVTVAWPASRHQAANRGLDHTNLVASLKSAEDGVAGALGLDDWRFRYESFDQIRAEDEGGWVRYELEPEG